MQHTFGRQALPIVWDFAEIVPISDAPGNWKSGYELIGDVIDSWVVSEGVGQTALADVTLPPESTVQLGPIVLEKKAEDEHPPRANH